MTWRRIGSGGIAPPFLNSALDGGEWSASRTACFTLGEKSPQNPLDRRLGRPQRRPRGRGKEKISCPYQESNLARPAYSTSVILISIAAFKYIRRIVTDKLHNRIKQTGKRRFWIAILSGNHEITIAGIAQSVDRRTMAWTAEKSGFDSRHGQEILLFFIASRPSRGPPSLLLNGYGGLFSWG
jgi:hypothetical protein